MNFDSNKASKGLLIAFGLIVGIFMAISVTTNPAGGLAAMVPLITVFLTILAFVKPRAGLYALVPLVIWVDEFKRLAVYFGGAYSMTVYQTLAMPFVVLAALNAGFLVHGLFGRIKIDLISYFFFLVAGIIGISLFLTVQGSLPERIQRSANLAGYITLIPIAYTYLTTPDEWRKFFGLQVIYAFPAAAWAIKQYYFGFDTIEWTYALSGLSQVHSGQMLMALEPRTFGFFGSASALGCVAIYCAFAWWHTFRYKKSMVLWLLCSLVLTWVLIVSTQRTALVYPLIVFVCAWFFRTHLRTLALVTFAFGTFLAGVFASNYLINEGLDSINRGIASESRWGEKVLMVSTFSDRLVGWQRLKRPESWSLFGTGDVKQSGIYTDKIAGTSDDNHDIINKVLISYGAVGLVFLTILMGGLIWVLTRVPNFAMDRQSRNDAAFALALALPAVGLSFIAGDNFNTNPINMQIWTCFSGVLVCRRTFLARNAAAIQANTPPGERGKAPESDANVPVARPSASKLRPS